MLTTDPRSYHSGELAAQDKAGTRGAAAELAVGKRNALNFSNNHDAFLAAQSFAVVSSVDMATGNVWVTPLFGKAGDLSAVSEHQINISKQCIPQHDRLNLIERETPVSLLGIDLAKRTRHRINGIAQPAKQGSGVQLDVKEYSPNCPKYINRREIIYDTQQAATINTAAQPELRTQLTAHDQSFIELMDTLWIGSYAPNVGADCNHRGGKPGFIRVTSPNTIEWPEYRGNGTFFTSGNLEVNNRAGVTLVDFDTGSMLQLTGTATVDWEHDGRYEGASRAIVFHIEQIIRTDNATHHRWKRLDYSPYNPAIAGAEQSNTNTDYPVDATLVKIVEETPLVKTFRFVVPRRLKFLPGQYATFEFANIPGGAGTEVRTWTLSETPNSINGDNTLDITVKRVPNGLITNWLHDHAQLGLNVKLNGIQGDMTAVQFDPVTEQPHVPEHLLLLSAGIGITPNLAMVRGIGAFVLQNNTQITMIHVERNASDLLSQNELNRRAASYPNFNYTNIISSEQGRLTKQQLQTLVPHAEQQQAYICGPTQFMQDMTEYLVAIGVPAANIHTESFEF